MGSEPSLPWAPWFCRCPGPRPSFRILRGGCRFRLGPAFQGHFNHVSPCVLGRGTLNVQGNEAASPVRQARLLAPGLQCH